MNEVEKILQLDKILEDLNKAFEPITKDMESNLKILQDFVGDKSGLDFKPITMDEIDTEDEETK